MKMLNAKWHLWTFKFTESFGELGNSISKFHLWVQINEYPCILILTDHKVVESTHLLDVCHGYCVTSSG